MNAQFVIAVARAWVFEDQKVLKRLKQDYFPLPEKLSFLAGGERLILKARIKGKPVIEEIAVKQLAEAWFIKSHLLCSLFTQEVTDPYVLLFVEASVKAGRVVAMRCSADALDLLAVSDPPIRLEAFDLPPTAQTLIDADHIIVALRETIATEDPELFSAHTDAFLRAPHILVPLFAHVLSLSSKENIDFPLVLKTLSEQLRVLLTNRKGAFQLKSMLRDHASLWYDVMSKRIAFLDGGMSRISGVPSTEPLALRVGIYGVRPGETDLDIREEWVLEPYVLGDLVCPVDPDSAGEVESPDGKRLQEAARYVLEPLTALKYLDSRLDTLALLLHGPLINQFTQYDEGEPNYLPSMDPQFLTRFGINAENVSELIKSIPRSSGRKPMWNQFMAVYGAVTKRIMSHSVPIVGVVERSSGRAIGKAVLNTLVQEGQITESLSRKMLSLIERYGISDDFLFGCILKEGEYLPPVAISKNFARRARLQWQDVVSQYPEPRATVLKSSAASFPFRVEFNDAAMSREEIILRLLYHTSRLLPRYAFPVGLDIADKYAKIPDWLSRGVSARLSADVLRRALDTGDPNIVAQIRQFLARSPRDFFYRPQA